MLKIKYSVWFHGTEDEPEGICYSGREPFVVDDKKLAEGHIEFLKGFSAMVDNRFSICMIIVDDIT